MKNYTYIVPAGLITQALAKCKAAKDDPLINLPGLDGMFQTALVRNTDADGAAARWFISSGPMSDEEVAYLNAQLPGPFEASDGTLEITNPDGSKSIVEEGPHAMLARLGRKLRSVPMGATP